MTCLVRTQEIDHGSIQCLLWSWAGSELVRMRGREGAAQHAGAASTRMRLRACMHACMHACARARMRACVADYMVHGMCTAALTTSAV